MNEQCNLLGYAQPEGTTLLEQVCNHEQRIDDLESSEVNLEPRVEVLETDNTQNKSDIAQNQTDIGNNTTSIGNNTSNINTNATNISNNAGAIANNTTAIGNNTTAISNKVDVTFKNFKVAGQGDVVASLKEDNLEIEAGANITITTNPTTKKVTINGTGVIGTNASQVAVADIGDYYTGNEAETVLQEVGLKNQTQDTNITQNINDIIQLNSDVSQNTIDISNLSDLIDKSAGFINDNTIEIAKTQLETAILGAVPNDYDNRYGLKVSPDIELGCTQDLYKSLLTGDLSAGNSIVLLESTTGLVVGMEITIQDTLNDNNFENALIQSVDSPSQITLTSNTINSYTIANNATVYRSVNGALETLATLTGQLYTMSSDVLPVPFVVSRSTIGSVTLLGDAWNAYDNSNASSSGCSFVADGEGIENTIDLGLGNINKPLEMLARIGSNVGGTGLLTITFEEEGGATEVVYTSATTLESDIVIPITSAIIPRYIHTKLIRSGSGGTEFYIYKSQVTEWETFTSEPLKNYFRRKKVSVNKSVDIIAEQIIIDNSNTPTLEKHVSIENVGSNEVYQVMTLDETSIDGTTKNYSLDVVTPDENVIVRTKYTKTNTVDPDSLLAEYGGVS